MGTIADNLLEAVQATETTNVSEDIHTQGLGYELLLRIYDWESRREWWREHINASFPTWAKLGRLELGYLTRTWNLV